jgi:hypothetical protein
MYGSGWLDPAAGNGCIDQAGSGGTFALLSHTAASHFQRSAIRGMKQVWARSWRGGTPIHINAMTLGGCRRENRPGWFAAARWREAIQSAMKHSRSLRCGLKASRARLVQTYGAPMMLSGVGLRLTRRSPGGAGHFRPNAEWSIAPIAVESYPTVGEWERAHLRWASLADPRRTLNQREGDPRARRRRALAFCDHSTPSSRSSPVSIR